eukprot:Gregarina_sp_Pseudo_9__5148@NODE_545_length_2598_cov_36_562329_g515_i0_p1_GENE_NODE_545_length_2598_cov_36_562329_g515_i0NODE_545_length_2598_cov_36_562329_g515_i0_p1_ORF_typecomplete_len798_score241_24zfCCCH/PF00642_24/7_6e03zfCCCH/PF00642_24/8_8e06zf_CCCH_4/PF18345_1/9_8e02zf_CCCH_4/PF18345_1/0_00019zfCCCH_4/PF18044_1/8_6e02zfCCCH_4/PF18044_1/0_00048Torus/PF16131_5/0_0036zfCCCH_3/PF15663_5/0_0056zfCCCH_2/PF14608_6/0_15_NODE_545_length_2598_cov_36_562329_g515_i01092502
MQHRPTRPGAQFSTEPPPPAPTDKERFLQDLARVVPSLSLSAMRGADLLQTILQESQAHAEATLAPSDPKPANSEITSSILKSLLQVGVSDASAAAVHDPAIKQRSSTRNTQNAQRQQNAQWKRPPPSLPRMPSPVLMASAEALVARSLLRATPSPFAPPTSSHPDLTELNWDEEGTHSHWPVDDETVFYRSHKLAPSAEQHGVRGFYDLNIVMPLIIPAAEIRVLNADGENYYNLAHTNPGAHLLFGRETRIKPNSGVNETASPATGPSAPPTAASGGSTERLLETDDDDFPVQPPTDAMPYPAVCDIWATFLNAHLGTIRNCRGNQIVEICELFNSAFAGDEFTQFLVPITVDCRGIYPVPRPAAKQTFERYETRGVFLTENDRRRFRIIRRRLKKFVLMLWDKYGVQVDGPKFDVALGDNCRSTPNDSIHIEIRRYGALSHPQLLKHIWKNPNSGKSLDLHPVFELPGLPAIPAQARVNLNEVRLEMTHARMVDPRWPDQWVLARRMPAVPASTTRRPVMARYVFCSRVEMPRVIYEFNQPKKALLKSRFSPLYLLADVSRRDMLAALEEEKQQQAAKTKLSATAVPFFPLSAVLNKLATTQPTPPPPPTAGSPNVEAQLLSNARAETASPLTGGAAKPSAWDRLVTSATIAGVVDSSSVPGSSFYSSNRTSGGTVPGSNPVPAEQSSFDPDPFLTRLSPGAFNMASLLSPPSARRILTEGVSPSLPTTLRKTPYSNRYNDTTDILPITEEPCKFYRAGVCARGDACYFLHPADPQLENRVDVRHLSPANPIFF